MFVVVNVKNRIVMCPKASGFMPGQKSETSVVQDEPEARKFAEFCAKKWQDQEFALLGLLEIAKSSAPPVSWSKP